MNAERHTKMQSRPTGLFATLANLLRTGGTGAPSRHVTLCGALAMLLACLLLPSAASAHQARLFAGTFGAASNPAPFPANPYPLKFPAGVAVDNSTGDVYVIDGVASRVEKFDSEGHFLLMFGHEVNKTALETPGREAEANLCPAPGHPADVCQRGKDLFRHTPLEEPSSIAVDNSTGPSQGDVYLANGGQIGQGEHPTTGLVEKFAPSGLPLEGWGEGGILDGSSVTDPPAPIAGPFTVIAGMTVDPSGNLWVSARSEELQGVLHPGGLFEFSQSGEFHSGFEPHFEEKSNGGHVSGQLAIDAEGNTYFVVGGFVFKFNPEAKEIGQVAPDRREAEEAPPIQRRAFAIAVDPSTDELYLAGTDLETIPNVQRGVVKRYGASCRPAIVEVNPQPGCEPAEEFGSGLVGPFSSVAIDPVPAAAPVYVAGGGEGTGHEPDVTVFSLQTVPDVTTTRPLDPTATTATLTGTVDPSGVELNPGTEGCRFEYVEAALYQPDAADPYAAGHTAPCDRTAAQIGEGSVPVEVQAPITGLQAGHAYHYRLVASNPNDENATVHQPSLGADLLFGPPTIESASALSVTSTEAVLQAEVDPEAIDTHVRIEYGTEAGVYGHSTEAVDLGAATSPEAATFQLTGLAPGTAYHYRAVAENALAEGPEAVIGPDLAFTTQAPVPAALPDDRAWELVSPPDKHGAALRPITEGVTQASASGDAITYIATAPTEAAAAGNADKTQVLSARGPSGWSSRDLNAPHESPTGSSVGNQGNEYRFFSADLSRSVFQPDGAFEPSLSPEATEQTAFLRTDFPAGQPTAFCASSCYQPLVTRADDQAEPFRPFGEEGHCPPANFCGPDFRGATEDLGHIVLASGGHPGTATEVGLTADPEDHGGLYEWSAGRLDQVSVLPDGHPAPVGAVFGEGPSARGAISADGSRIAWTLHQQGQSKLYLRDMARGETLQLDAREPGCAKCQGGEAVFQLASADGSRVFFTDLNRLTADSGAESPGKADLYECAVVESEAGGLECRLTDLTPEAGGEAAEVQGAVLGASEDGSYLYFVADGALTGPEQNAEHEAARPGRPNLYLRHEGRTTFIAGLSGADSPDWSSKLQDLTARVSPDGRWLAFMSERPLTGYDNRDAQSGRPDQEVFLYHAAAGAGGEGDLLCASCNPTGARPHGLEFEQISSSSSGLAALSSTFPPTAWIAANLPAWSAYSGENGVLYQSRYLSDSGRLFFNSSDALVPQDSNGTEDVYQYEPPAGGEEAPPGDTCALSSPTYSPASQGCVSLISSGASAEQSAFLDASESGDDVFFLTAAQLSRRDTDTALDVYDARVGGGEPQPARPVECEGDGCQLPAVPPADPTPGSLTFHGAGNVVEKPAKKKHAKKHRKHKKKAHHKRAGSNRGGGK